MFDPDGFQQFIDQIQLSLGVPEDVAGHYAVSIGDTPILGMDGRAYQVLDPQGRPTVLPVELLNAPVSKRLRTTSLLSLTVGRWYMAEFFSDFDHPANASEWYSPVRIHHWKTDPDHPGLHSLAFFHANYPEGVQDKSYSCRIVGHTSRCLLLARVDDAPRNQHLWLRPLTWRIMEKTLPDFTRSLRAMPKAATLLQTALDAKFQFKRNSR